MTYCADASISIQLDDGYRMADKGARKNEQDDDNSEVEESENPYAIYQVEYKRVRPPGPIKFATHFVNTLQDALNGLGWVHVREDETWDLHWCNVGWVKEVYDHVHLPDYVRICHYRNHYELTGKDLVVKNVKR